LPDPVLIKKFKEPFTQNMEGKTEGHDGLGNDSISPKAFQMKSSLHVRNEKNYAIEEVRSILVTREIGTNTCPL
jgi:hypothetical protein